MNPARWKEAQRLYHEALERPQAERGAFLRQATYDEALIAAVERMLRSAPDQVFLDPPAFSESEPGHVLGDFTLQQEIGRGAMGVVYRAVQRSLDRTVAVKVLPASFALSARQIERFEREARATARLAHPSIVSIVTVGESAGVRWFAMELVEGDNLAQEIARLRAELGAVRDEHAHLPSTHAADYFRTVAELMRQAADGLAHAHAHGIVHRDIKPSNLLLAQGGLLKIVDFGLARDEALGSLSRSGDVMGTPHYMSPEQALAQRHKVDHRTDVYSLGVVLYELLTLKRPFEGKTSDEVIQNLLHVEQQPVRKCNPRVPRDLETICAKAMAKETRQRYSSAGDLRDDLQRFLHHEAILAQAPRLGQRLARFVRRRALPLGVAAVLLTGSGAGTLWTRYAIHASEKAEIRRTLSELELLPDWTELDPERLRDARRALEAFARRDPVGSRELRTRLDGRFDELLREWKQQALERIEHGKHARSPEEVGAVDDSEVLAGFVLLTTALKVFPEDDELARLVSIEVFHPRVSIDARDAAGQALPGRAAQRLLDQVTGLPGSLTDLGPLPIEARALKPGFYRFLVQVDGQRPREFTRLLQRAQDPLPIRCTIPSAAETFEGMLLVEGGVLRTHEQPADQMCPFLGREIAVDAFWLDENEVSIGDYKAYLSATASPPPYEWQWLPPGNTHDDLPVSAISWHEAVAYAEWAGKRLVTHAEWELAARGPAGDLFGEEGAYAGAVFGEELPSGDVQERFEHYLAGVSPVRAPEGRGRNGLYHMLGNVFEWTESLGFDLNEGEYVAAPGYRLLLSTPWSARSRKYTLATHRLSEPERSFANPEHGFRCARSASQ